MAKKEKLGKDINLLQAIRQESLYKSNIKRRDKQSRKIIENECTTNINSKRSILPGQLIMFKYFSPKLKEDLEYYDAWPCTIFFGIRKTDDGDRVIGFNLHYYPPKIRYALMDKVFELYKSSYYPKTSKNLTKAIPQFQYELFIYKLRQAKLDFGIRMYIPSLMQQITPIPPDYWSKAVFTEGMFKKTTREAIINYWKQKQIDQSYIEKMGKKATKKN